MPRFLGAVLRGAVLRGAALTAVLFFSGTAPASAACVLQTDPYLPHYICDVYTEADLRQVNALVPSYPFPDVMVMLRANVTVNGSIDFGHVNSLTVDTNGFTLVGDSVTNPPGVVKTGMGSMRLTGFENIQDPPRHLRHRSGHAFIQPLA
jgi:hypothetical protein